MTNKDYQKNVERLKEIEALVKDPQTGMDKIDELLSETQKLVNECREYTRSLSDKIEEFENA